MFLYLNLQPGYLSLSGSANFNLLDEAGDLNIYLKEMRWKILNFVKIANGLVNIIRRAI